MKKEKKFVVASRSKAWVGGKQNSYIYLTKHSRWTADEKLKGLWTESEANYLASAFKADVLKVL